MAGLWQQIRLGAVGSMLAAALGLSAVPTNAQNIVITDTGPALPGTYNGAASFPTLGLFYPVSGIGYAGTVGQYPIDPLTLDENFDTSAQFGITTSTSAAGFAQPFTLLQFTPAGCGTTIPPCAGTTPYLDYDNDTLVIDNGPITTATGIPQLASGPGFFAPTISYDRFGQRIAATGGSRIANFGFTGVGGNQPGEDPNFIVIFPGPTPVLFSADNNANDFRNLAPVFGVTMTDNTTRLAGVGTAVSGGGGTITLTNGQRVLLVNEATASSISILNHGLSLQSAGHILADDLRISGRIGDPAADRTQVLSFTGRDTLNIRGDLVIAAGQFRTLNTAANQTVTDVNALRTGIVHTDDANLGSALTVNNNDADFSAVGNADFSSLTFGTLTSGLGTFDITYGLLQKLDGGSVQTVTQSLLTGIQAPSVAQRVEDTTLNVENNNATLSVQGNLIRSDLGGNLNQAVVDNLGIGLFQDIESNGATVIEARSGVAGSGIFLPSSNILMRNIDNTYNINNNSLEVALRGNDLNYTLNSSLTEIGVGALPVNIIQNVQDNGADTLTLNAEIGRTTFGFHSDTSNSLDGVTANIGTGGANFITNEGVANNANLVLGLNSNASEGVTGLTINQNFNGGLTRLDVITRDTTFGHFIPFAGLTTAHLRGGTAINIDDPAITVTAAVNFARFTPFAGGAFSQIVNLGGGTNPIGLTLSQVIGGSDLSVRSLTEDGLFGLGRIEVTDDATINVSDARIDSTLIGNQAEFDFSGGFSGIITPTATGAPIVLGFDQTAQRLISGTIADQIFGVRRIVSIIGTGGVGDFSLAITDTNIANMVDANRATLDVGAVSGNTRSGIEVSAGTQTLSPTLGMQAVLAETANITAGNGDYRAGPAESNSAGISILNFDADNLARGNVFALSLGARSGNHSPTGVAPFLINTGITQIATANQPEITALSYGHLVGLSATGLSGIGTVAFGTAAPLTLSIDNVGFQSDASANVIDEDVAGQSGGVSGLNVNLGTAATPHTQTGDATVQASLGQDATGADSPNNFGIHGTPFRAGGDAPTTLDIGTLNLSATAILNDRTTDVGDSPIAQDGALNAVGVQTSLANTQVTARNGALDAGLFIAPGNGIGNLGASVGIQDVNVAAIARSNSTAINFGSTGALNSPRLGQATQNAAGSVTAALNTSAGTGVRVGGNIGGAAGPFEGTISIGGPDPSDAVNLIAQAGGNTFTGNFGTSTSVTSTAAILANQINAAAITAQIQGAQVGFTAPGFAAGSEIRIENVGVRARAVGNESVGRIGAP